MQTLSLQTAQQNFLTILQSVWQGEEVVITEKGKPDIHLQAVKKPSKRKLGTARHALISMGDDFDEPLDDFRDYM